MLGNSKLIGYTVAIIAAYGSYFADLAEAPFLFQRMGMGRSLSGFLYAPIAFSDMGGTFMGRKLLARTHFSHVVMIGCILFTFGGAAFFLSSLQDISHPLALVVPMSIVASGNGCILSLSMAGALSLFRNAAGDASGLIGTLQWAGASLATACVGFMHKGTARPLASWVMGMTFIGMPLFWLLVGRTKTIPAKNNVPWLNYSLITDETKKHIAQMQL